MAGVVPQLGMIVRYGFAFEPEDKDSNNKTRPAMILFAHKSGLTLVVPITHSEPKEGQDTLEIPDNLKEQLDLDEDKQWIHFNAANLFTWMGYDLVPSDTYPIAPRPFYEAVARRYLEIANAGRVTKINRD